MADSMKVRIIGTTSQRIESLPINDGQIIFLDDASGAYYDRGGVRRSVVDPFAMSRATNIYAKEIAVSDWTLNDTTGAYECTIPSSEHNCGTAAYVISTEATVDGQHILIIYDSATDVLSGDITVSVTEPVDGRAIIAGVVPTSNNAYIKNVQASEWSATSSGTYQITIPATVHLLGSDVFVADASQTMDYGYDKIVHNATVTPSGDVTVEVSQPIDARITIASATVSFEATDSTRLESIESRVTQNEANIENIQQVLNTVPMWEEI